MGEFPTSAIFLSHSNEARRTRQQNRLLRSINGVHGKNCQPGGFSMKRRLSRPVCAIARRVETLRTLVPNPNGSSESAGLDELFSETAEYIMCLQRRVRLMQSLVNVLSGSDE